MGFKIALGSVLLASTAAWNTDVHNQIGFMAEQFLHAETIAVVEEILEPQYNGSIGRAAAWADAYAHTDEGRFSYQWHWITTHDSAPKTCNLNYTDDCSPGGCVVSAIANQTEILKACIQDVKAGSLSGGSNLTCSYALKWVTHYIGDITQPLHASGRAVGGNLIPVIFDGERANLHAAWDKFIPYADAKVTGFSNESIDPFFQNLLTRIRQDQFFEAPYMWLSCSNPNTPVTCATRWAEETNAWNCDYVYKHFDNSTDLATNGYAAGAIPIVELQISKAALRLGTWLNKLVEESKWYRPGQQVVLLNDDAEDEE
ncbi:nuclease PA3 [Westerdykella ornata]|uniref:Nuclease PA3 n=1 Tax=Westerdykella ornata TaxID=318751 RepID=A0A6A6J796_WESOR|nr:nuclease PA3 [Westerdykella ornata]KAF2272067.1 nuclease PA3 [Westerdykella ornata]